MSKQTFHNTDVYIRNVIFGVSDSLVSTVGLLSGINASGTSRASVIAVGIVYAFVEAFSMALGSFLSEESVEEFLVKGEVSRRKPFTAGLTMFVAFILSSFIPIAPYVAFPFSSAFWLSLFFSIATLFVVGMVSARLSNTPLIKHALKTALLGGAAVILGVIVGKFFKTV